MTHTLHRFDSGKNHSKDYIVMTMAAQNYNDKGAAAKLVTNMKLMVEAGPVNYGDDNNGGILSGLEIDEILEMADDGAYMAAVYDNISSLKKALLKLKEADNGMSVVLTGNFQDIYSAISEAGLKPHTVNISIGFHGKKELTPKTETLEITSMCGHGMVCPKLAEMVMGKVRKRSVSPEDGALELAKPCTCAIFNPTRASEILGRCATEYTERDSSDAD
jgi:hypothetical protein